VSVGGVQTRAGLGIAALAALLVWVPAGHATFPGRNGRIAFDVEGKGVFATGPTGKGRRLLARRTDEEPAWSRGGRLAVQRNGASAASAIFVRRGHSLRALTGPLSAAGPADIQPAWSPDGRRVAFARALPAAQGRSLAGFDIYVARVKGGRVRRLTTDVGNDTQPAWSPNGKRIAFTSDRAGNQDLYTMRPNGRGLRRLTGTSAEDSSPSWSPNGRRIAFTSDRNGSDDVFTMTARGRALRRLTRSSAEEGDPAWSPNGRRIAYAVAGRGLYVMSPTGRGKRRLKGGAGGRHPDWRRR
jgi:tol-pal system beta propeller repeat protein TolB